MSDIVHRLRDWRNLHLARGGELFEAAADEIARLRLTEAEQEAVEAAVRIVESREAMEEFTADNAATLRGLLERLA